MYFYFYSAVLMCDFHIFTLSSFIFLYASGFSLCAFYIIVLKRADGFQLSPRKLHEILFWFFQFALYAIPRSDPAISCLARLCVIHVSSSRISSLFVPRLSSLNCRKNCFQSLSRTITKRRRTRHDLNHFLVSLFP